MGRLFMAATATMIVAAAAPARTAATPFQQDGTHSRSQLQSAVHFNEAGSTGGGGGGNVFRIGRALLADRCAGCEPELCFPATGCAACDVEAGYQPDGAGGCMKGARARISTFAMPDLGSSNQPHSCTHPILQKEFRKKLGSAHPM